MSMPSPTPSGGPRASRGIKLVLMGVAGAALLDSCAPGVGAGLSALPYLWFLPNPFYRPPVASCPPDTPNCQQQAATSSSSGTGGSSTSSRSSSSSATTDTSRSSSTQTAPTTSQRGGFGSTGSSSSSGSS